MHIRVDVSVFSSPVSAFGIASGEIELSEMPKEHEAFPWPSDWLTAKPEYFTPEQSRVWSVTEKDGQPFVMLKGIVCNSIAEAQECAAFLEARGGLFFEEYKHREPGSEAYPVSPSDPHGGR